MDGSKSAVMSVIVFRMTLFLLLFGFVYICQLRRRRSLPRPTLFVFECLSSKGGIGKQFNTGLA